MLSLLAIVGRPNVGKSALFNRISKRRIAIVHAEPGVTRDRIAIDLNWNEACFTLVDTGGIGMWHGEKTGDELADAALKQVNLAIDEADVILFVVDTHEGITPLDEDIAAQLRASNKPVLLVSNKADNERIELNSSEFAALGFDYIYPVSAIHDRGISAVMNHATKLLIQHGKAEIKTNTDTPDSSAERPVNLAFVGKPNAGKSSIINALLKSERVLVSSIPGTTRDSVHVPLTIETDGIRRSYNLIDTAGIRKKRSVGSSVEFFSVKRAENSIEACDIAILVVDAEEGILEQDKKVAGLIAKARKACIVVITKWDLIPHYQGTVDTGSKSSAASGGSEPEPTLDDFGRWVQSKLFFLDFAPVIFASSKTGFNLDRLLGAIDFVSEQYRQKVSTGILNRVLNDAIEFRQPLSATGKRLKFFYAVQTHTAPPQFMLFVNRDELFSQPYVKYLAGRLRDAFGFEGCPIVIKARPRPKTIAPKRNRDKQV
ncbi:MAG: ribosome biogenesis GTPase Der [Verrucomicrobia bacterium]|nr:ribosome biogenesis GTPase Der [Verrucomicrobiota bacterium]